MAVVNTTRLYLLGGAILVGATALVAGGAWLGYAVLSDKPARESAVPAPQVRQADGSLIAARVPMTPREAGPAPHMLPPGSTELRRITTRLVPRPVVGTAPDGAPTCSCEPIELATSLVDDGAGGIRAVQSALGADITQGTDTPLVLSTIGAKPRPWSAGLSYGPTTREPGAWVARDIGAARARLDLIARKDGIEPRLALGWAW